MQSPDFWIFISIFTAGTVTLALRKRKEPVNFMVFCGEVILAGGLGSIYWIAGLYAGMDSIQVFLFAAPSAYGQVALITKFVQFKNNGIQTSK